MKKFRALHTKFMKVCGVHQSELFQKVKDNMFKKKTDLGKSESEWNPDEGDEESKEETKDGGKKGGFYGIWKFWN